MTKEIAKINYSLEAFGDGPIGVMENVAENDAKLKNIQIVQPGHRVLTTAGSNVKIGSFIDGNTFEMLAEGFGDEKHPVPGIRLLFIHMTKNWRIFSKVPDLKSGKMIKGDWIESQPWTPANAAMYKLKPDNVCSLVYSYLVKVEGKEHVIPSYLNFKGLTAGCASELNTLFRDKWLSAKRPSFSMVVTLKTRSEATSFGSNVMMPYVFAVDDASEEEFLFCTKIYKASKDYMNEVEEREKAVPASDPVVARMKDAFGPDLVIDEVDIVNI